MSKTTRAVRAKHSKARSNSFTVVALVASLSLAFAGLVATVTASSASAASIAVSADDTTDSASVDRVQKPPTEDPCNTQPRKGLKTNTDCQQPDPCKDKKGTKSGSEGCDKPDPCKDKKGVKSDSENCGQPDPCKDKKGVKSDSENCGHPDPCKDKSGTKSDSDNCGHPDPCKDQASTDSVNNGPVDCNPCKDNVVLSSSDNSNHDRCKFYGKATFPLPPATICVTTETGKDNVVLPAVIGNGTGTSKVSQEAADAEALANAGTDANNQRAAQKAQYAPNYTDGICVWTAEKTVNVNESVCANVAGSNQTVDVTGTGTATASSEISQADADQKAIDAATPLANQNLAANKALLQPCTNPPPPGGDTPPGTTTTTTTPPVEPVVVVAPGTVETPSVVAPGTVPPLAGTVPASKPNKPAKKPTTVTTPQAATVPAAVPAGGGSSVPANGMPIWALSMLVIGALGAAGAGLRLVGSRTK